MNRGREKYPEDETVPTWLLIIPLLAFLVFVHELGHYFAAKRFGIMVLEFGFGFPPRLFGIRRGETIYSINAIPLGGFVRMLGEEDPSHPRSFANQTVLKRTIVLCAGSVMNFAVAFIIFAVIFLMPRDVLRGSVTITGVAPGSPAAEAGIRPGDQILAVDGESARNHQHLIALVRLRLGEETEFTVRRGAIVSGIGQSPDTAVTESVILTPRLQTPDLEVVDTVTDPSAQVSEREARRYDARLRTGDVMSQGAIGVMLGLANARIVQEQMPVWEAPPQALGRMWDVVEIQGIAIRQWASGGPDPGFAGPIGIAQATGEVARMGRMQFFQLAALISMSLGILNILPIPALDGGRLAFVLLEWARRGKRISPRKEGMTHLIGFGILIALIIVISFFDISRILSGGSLLE